jgi:hypothetical protein
MDGEIKIKGEVLSIKLTPDQKHQICKSFFASPHFNLDAKK